MAHRLIVAWLPLRRHKGRGAQRVRNHELVLRHDICEAVILPLLGDPAAEHELLHSVIECVLHGRCIEAVGALRKCGCIADYFSIGAGFVLRLPPLFPDICLARE